MEGGVPLCEGVSQNPLVPQVAQESSEPRDFRCAHRCFPRPGGVDFYFFNSSIRVLLLVQHDGHVLVLPDVAASQLEVPNVPLSPAERIFQLLDGVEVGRRLHVAGNEEIIDMDANEGNQLLLLDVSHFKPQPSAPVTRFQTGTSSDPLLDIVVCLRGV